MEVNTDLKEKSPSYSSLNSSNATCKGSRCAYCYTYRSDAPERKFFKFPLNEDLCKKWLNACNRPYLFSKSIQQLHNNYRLCSEHFNESDYTSYKKRYLCVSAVPHFESDSLEKSDGNEMLFSAMKQNLLKKISFESKVSSRMKKMKEHKGTKFPTRAQTEFLVSFMEKHPQLASGRPTELFTSNEKERMWEDLKNELNSVDSTFKTKNQWKKTWTDKKSNIRCKAMFYKKRLKKNPNETAPKFTLIEKRIMKLIGLEELSEACPTLDTGFRFYFKKTEDQLKSSGSKISISGSLLPSLTEMEIDYEQQSIADGAVKSELVSSVDVPILIASEQKLLVDGACTSEHVTSESVKTYENTPEWNLFQEYLKMKKSTMSENALENQITIKQEPPDYVLHEPSSSSALELLQPVIVSVTPVLTTEESPVPAIKVAVAGSTGSNEPHSPAIGSPAPSPSKEDSRSYSLLNTAQGTKSEARVFELNSDNLVTTTEKPQLEDCNDDTDPGPLLNEGKQRISKGKQSVAMKAADALTEMAKRNCIVLERIATAIEIQAAQSVKQTELIDRLVNILSKN